MPIFNQILGCQVEVTNGLELNVVCELTRETVLTMKYWINPGKTGVGRLFWDVLRYVMLCLLWSVMTLYITLCNTWLCYNAAYYRHFFFYRLTGESVSLALWHQYCCRLNDWLNCYHQNWYSAFYSVFHSSNVIAWICGFVIYCFFIFK